jgi:hypothetical protein
MKTLLLIVCGIGLIGAGVLGRWMWETLKRDANKREEDDW